MKTRIRIIKRIAATLAFLAMTGTMLLAAAAPAGAQEAGWKNLDEARLSVDKSSLTREAKLDILTKADRAVNAGIPPEDVAVIINRGLKERVEGARISGFLEIAAGVKEQKVPVRLVLDRIEQGLSKGVPAERISAVVQGLAGKLAAARPIVNTLVERGVKPVRGGSPDDAVETVARALEKSIPENAIVRTGEQVKERKGTVALFDRAVDAMTIFVGNGMTVDQASRLIRTAMDRGYSEHDFDGMERYMTGELRKGRAMNDIVTGMESGIERGEKREGREMPGGGPMRGPGSGMGAGPGMGGGGMGGRR